MGEVYRGRDERLGRDVAIKVLNARFHGDPEHIARLSREARAAGGLNHPNILAVYDVGTQADAPYVVSELLQGQSLRDRLTAGPLPYSKALKYGIELAQALGAAHENKIWHHDVKPANVFITTDGRVKLLDFGLATRPVAEGHADPDDTTVSAEPQHHWGTGGYMPPEQILGQTVDHRADLFALGAVLYEMFTGARAFQRATDAEVRSAVLHSDPVDPRELNPHLPEGVVAVLRRCLEKNKEERYQSARDLGFHLQQLQREFDGSRSGTLPIAYVRGRRFAWRPLAALLLIGGVCLAAGALLGSIAARRPDPSFEQLTFRRGRIGGARFTSDGGAVIYSEARPVYAQDGQRNRLEIWRIDVADSPQSSSLDIEGADVLAVRPGELALSLGRHYVGSRRFVGTLARRRLGSEESPREVATDIEEADWDPAGNDMVVARRLGGSVESVLEYPIGHAVFSSTGGIRSPRMSRDGRRIAFLHDPGGTGGGRVAVVDLAGAMTELTEHWPSARGLAWSPGGDEVWFAAAEGRANRALRGVSLAKRQRVVLQAPSSLTLWDVTRDGSVLLARDDDRNALVGLAPGWKEERDLSWFDASGVADLSDDGQTLLFGDRFGVYMRKTDGSPPKYLGLTDGFADDFSPDGSRALATSSSTGELFILPTRAGQPRPLGNKEIASYRGALWCPDGRHIVFNGVAGKELRAYVQDVSRDPLPAPSPLTSIDTWALAVSPDGKLVAATQPGKGTSLWPMDGGPSRDLPGSQPDDRPVAFTADGQAVWVFHRGEVPAQVLLVDVDTGRRTVWKTLWPPDPAGVYSITRFKVTPGGNAYFYSYASTLSQLYLVRGLK